MNIKTQRDVSITCRPLCSLKSAMRPLGGKKKPPYRPTTAAELFSPFCFLINSPTLLLSHNTYTHKHVSASLLPPQEAGKMPSAAYRNGKSYPDLAYSVKKKKNVAEYKGPVGCGSLSIQWRQKPGSEAWSGRLDSWIESAIQQWQTPSTLILGGFSV